MVVLHTNAMNSVREVDIIPISLGNVVARVMKLIVTNSANVVIKKKISGS